jgi:hypothetical protein
VSRRREERVFGGDLDLAGGDPEQRLAVEDEPRHGEEHAIKKERSPVDTEGMRVVSLGFALVALVATIGVFTFAKPQYRVHCDGCGKALQFDEATPPVNGWHYADATPGFHFGEHENLWNISLLLPREVPREAGVLASSRIAPHVRPGVLYWQRGCIGAQLATSRTLLCSPRAAAVVIAQAMPRARGWNMFLTGVVRGDVTRVTVHARGATEMVMRGATRTVKPFPPQVVYDAKTPGWWGTFTDSTFQPVPWDATVDVYGKHGLIATTRIRFAQPGDALYCASALRGVCGISAQRRS